MTDINSDASLEADGYSVKQFLNQTPDRLAGGVVVILNVVNAILNSTGAAEIDGTVVSAVNIGIVTLLTLFYVGPKAAEAVRKISTRKALEGIALGKALAETPTIAEDMSKFVSPEPRRRRPIVVRKKG